MKKILLASSLIVLGMSSAFAADGKITINGLVTDNTCVVTTPQGKDLTVTLPTVSKLSLASDGATAGRTPFTLGLTGCQAGDVGTYFEPGATVDFATGLLNNAGEATNVKVQLVGDNNLPIRVLAGPQENSQFVTVNADGSAALNYYAEYYATGAATSGDVTTSVQYTITYP
ncbi:MULTISPECIES: fimbrial protein [unclassified Acinetobacter]|uniref:fimbrial protein n=1 Tax=unclassified Acinetobacter TaxID=196816 RepID=UPI0015D3A2C9|nr:MULTISPECIES: fimbrial protein [unclassified Acinetobacter]